MKAAGMMRLHPKRGSDDGQGEGENGRPDDVENKAAENDGAFVEMPKPRDDAQNGGHSIARLIFPRGLGSNPIAPRVQASDPSGSSVWQ